MSDPATTQPTDPDAAIARLGKAISASGLVAEGASVVALVSGGPDSTALLAGLRHLLGSERLVALHLDYRLRPDSGEDRSTVEHLCRDLGVELEVLEPALDTAEGNTQDLARESRYEAAEDLRARVGFDLVATGHTRTDLVETVLYRLAVSPGSRALLGLPARRGRVVRPLLSLTRSEIRGLVESAGLPFRDDPTNAEPLYARNRIRNEVLPVLDEIGHGSFEQTVAETRAELADQTDALESIAADALAPHLTQIANGVGVEPSGLASLHPELRRIALRQAAEAAAGRSVPLSRERAERILALAGEPEGGIVELGGGLEARAEFGQVLFVSSFEESRPSPAVLSVPGVCQIGEWEVRAEFAERPSQISGPEVAVCSRERLGAGQLDVRTWSEGDRIAPLGLDGSKSLADLFAERRIPRTLRRRLPVVVDPSGRVVWVAGVALSREFAAESDDPSPALIRASICAPATAAGAGSDA